VALLGSLYSSVAIFGLGVSGFLPDRSWKQEVRTRVVNERAGEGEGGGGVAGRGLLASCDEIL
jgi:hypothetical protein